MGFLRRIFSGGDSGDSLLDPSLRQAAKLTSEGNHHGGTGDLDRAIACFKRALAVKPDHVPAHLSLAIAYREKGDYESALEVLETAASHPVAGQPFNPSFEIAFHRGLVLLAKHKRDRYQNDMSDLISALESAQEIGLRRAPPTEDEKIVARALQVDIEADRQRYLEMLEVLIPQIHRQQGELE